MDIACGGVPWMVLLIVNTARTWIAGVISQDQKLEILGMDFLIWTSVLADVGMYGNKWYKWMKIGSSSPKQPNCNKNSMGIICIWPMYEYIRFGALLGTDAPQECVGWRCTNTVWFRKCTNTVWREPKEIFWEKYLSELHLESRSHFLKIITNWTGFYHHL